MGIQSILQGTGFLSGLAGLAQAIGAKGLSSQLGAMSSSITSVTGLFTGLEHSVVPLVQAYQPSAVLQFNQAIYDATAVMGSAVVPVLDVLTGIMRDFGDSLLPLVTNLAPSIEIVTDLFGGLASRFTSVFSSLVATITPLGDAFVGMLVALEPLANAFINFEEMLLGGVSVILASLTPVFEGLNYALTALMAPVVAMSEPMRAMGVLFQGLAEGLRVALSGFLPIGKLQDSISDFRTSMGILARNALVAAAALAKFFGNQSILSGMINALGGNVNKGESTGFGAAQNAQVTDIMAFSRQMATAAATASGAAGKSAEDTWRDETLAALMDLKSGKDNWEKAAKRLIDDFLRDFLGGLPLTVQNNIKAWLEASEFIKQLLGNPQKIVDDVERGARVASQASGEAIYGRNGRNWLRRQLGFKAEG